MGPGLTGSLPEDSPFLSSLCSLVFAEESSSLASRLTVSMAVTVSVSMPTSSPSLGRAGPGSWAQRETLSHLNRAEPEDFPLPEGQVWGMHGSFSGQQMETGAIDYLLVKKTLGTLPSLQEEQDSARRPSAAPPPLSLGQVVSSSSICAQAYPGTLRAYCWQRWVMVFVSRGGPRPGSWHRAGRNKNLLGSCKNCHFCSTVHPL